jgi:hypothetical protein
MSKRALWMMASACGMCIVPLACGKNQDPNTSASFSVGTPTNTATTTGYGTPPPTTTGYGAPPPTAPTTAAPPPTASAAPPDLVGQLGGMLGGIVSGLGTGVPGADPITTGIQYNAQQNAPGMKGEGSVVRLQLNQGATGEGQITLQPGKCYTLVASSLPGVIDVAMRATLPAPMTQQVLGQNETTGPMPVVWAKDKCYRNAAPMAIPVRVEVVMKQGAGMVGFQPYAK